MTIYTPTLAREIFPSPLERLADRLYTRLLRFRARLRVLWRATKVSKLRVRIAVLLFIAFTLSPLDFIPDFIPVIGMLDEILVLMLVVWYCKRHDPAVARALTHLFS
jgi:uncharacterized membrane protein YkvA (DUF1232 family)